MATLKATGCKVGTQSITIFFSEPVASAKAGTYNIFSPDAGMVNTTFSGTPKLLPDTRSVLLEWPNPVFSAGEWVLVTVTGVSSSVAGVLPITSDQVSGRVPSEGAQVVKDVEDAISYPILTEEVAYRPSPVGIPTGGGGGIAGPGGSNIGQLALQAVTDVLGWKANPTDPKGFVGALTQAFTLTEVEGHVESKWVPRTYAVQTDLGGGITGAQASLYARAKDALDQSLALLDGLYPLDPEADPEYVKALREMARSQMNEIVKELGVVGLPSILRINTYFKILLDRDTSDPNTSYVEFDPDKIAGTLGELRDEYAIYFRGNRFNNSIEDEQDITNFRMISDYMTSLRQSWIANRDFFRIGPHRQAFFGTQLVLIARQFNVITETVNEARFALDSVFIGPNERQALLLKFKDHSLPPMFLEDMLDEIQSFATDEGPRLLRDGGKISVTNNILPVVRYLERLVKGAHDPEDPKALPDGFRTARVRHSLDDLQDQLRDLARLTEQVEQSLPPSEDKLAIENVVGPYGVEEKSTFKVSIFGQAFDPKVKVLAYSPAPTAALLVNYVTPQRIEVTFPYALTGGSHEIRMVNPDGESASLPNAFNWDAGKFALTINPVNLEGAIANVAYNVRAKPLDVSGGVAPYMWTVTRGNLPSGLTLAANGVLSGVPNAGAIGTNPFDVTVTDSNGSTASQRLSIAVVAKLLISTQSLPGATADQTYSQQLSASGGAQPYKWTTAPGDLPPGLSLSADGVLSGTHAKDPAVNYPSKYPFTVSVTDGTQSASAQFTVELADVVSNPAARAMVSRATVGSFYSQKLQATGGTAPLSWSLRSGSDLPRGLSLNADGIISGTPIADGTDHFSVQVTDVNGSSAIQPLVISAHDDVGDRVKHLDKMVDALQITVKDINDKLNQLLDHIEKNRKGKRDKNKAA
jgi:hypothetical protein